MGLHLNAYHQGESVKKLAPLTLIAAAIFVPLTAQPRLSTSEEIKTVDVAGKTGRRTSAIAKRDLNAPTISADVALRDAPASLRQLNFIKLFSENEKRELGKLTGSPRALRDALIRIHKSRRAICVLAGEASMTAMDSDQEGKDSSELRAFHQYMVASVEGFEAAISKLSVLEL
jgi:hypothetical protein